MLSVGNSYSIRGGYCPNFHCANQRIKYGSVGYILLRIFAFIHNLIPRPVTLFLSRGFGRLLHRFFKYRQAVALGNIAKAFPEHTSEWHGDILKKAYMHFVMVVSDFVRLPSISSNKINRFLEFDLDRMKSYFTDGGVLMTGHFGNWEALLLALRQLGIPNAGVVAPQQGGAGKFFDYTRRSFGAQIIHKNSPARSMLKLVKDGTIISIAADQDARHRGIWVDFFGHPSSRGRGGSFFAYQTGKPMVLCLCLMHTDYRYKIHMEPITMDDLPEDREKAVHVLTQRYISALEAGIRQYPEQYFWFHRMWKSPPPE